MTTDKTNVSQVLKRIDRMEGEIVDLLRDLIRVPSEVPPGEYDNIIELYSSKLREFGLNFEIIKKPGTKKPNVLCRVKGTIGKPTLILFAHLDTVPGGGGWEPFVPVVKGGMIYGRGSHDAKASVVAYTMAAKALMDEGIKLKGDLLLLSVVDDEVGAADTTQYIVENELVRADFLICEGMGQSQISIASSHVMVLELSTVGKVTHAQSPWRGVHPVPKMVKILSALQEWSEAIKKKRSGMEAYKDRTHPWTMTNIALVRAGEENIWNVFPERCTVQLELRIIPEQDPDEIVKEIEDIIRKLKREDSELEVELKELWRVPGFNISPDHPNIQKLKKAIKEVMGYDIPLRSIHGFVPTSFYAKIGVPGVTWNPGVWEESNLHEPDEHIKIDDLINGTKIYALAAMYILGCE